MLPEMTGPLFSFTKIIVADVERVYAFYNSVLGVEQHIRVRQGEGYDELDEIVSKPVGAQVAPTLAIKCFVNRPAPPPGEVQLGFVVRNVDEVVEAALEAGGKIAKPAVNQPQHGVRVAFIQDVEGHMIEVVELL